MPPKKKAAPASKKAAEKAKIVDDKTFGLKNKNKSKKVQTYVKQVEQQATAKVEGRRRGGGAGSSAADSAGAKKAALAAKLEELSLLNQPVADRPKKADADAEERKAAREAAEAERLRIANLPVEEQIEEERAKLTTRTPVTIALFTAWKSRKDAERGLRDAAALAAAQKGMSKAERNRGGGLTGRALFEQHQEIFVDDAEASGEKLKTDANAWIGDDEEAAGEEGGDGQNVPEDQHEPPAAVEEGEGEEGEETNPGVGDESLFS